MGAWGGGRYLSLIFDGMVEGNKQRDRMDGWMGGWAGMPRLGGLLDLVALVCFVGVVFLLLTPSLGGSDRAQATMALLLLHLFRLLLQFTWVLVYVHEKTDGRTDGRVECPFKGL